MRGRAAASGDAVPASHCCGYTDQTDGELGHVIASDDFLLGAIGSGQFPPNRREG